MSGMSVVFAFHTAAVMIEQVNSLFDHYLPEVTLRHMLDDSIIPEMLQKGRVTVHVSRRMMCFYQCAVDAGADLIFNTCSSVSDVVPAAQQKISVPIVQIDHAMAEKAVQSGVNIGILATLSSTLDPTQRLLHQKASENGKNICTVSGLADGAFEALKSGDESAHDNLIMQTARNIASDCDMFVLAQGSMARLENQLQNLLQKEVLSSPVSGVLAVKFALNAQSPPI